MRNLTLGDCRLVLRHLLGDKLDELRQTATGKLYEPRLRRKQKAIDAIPEAALAEAPFAAELAKADADHDGLGAATHYLCLAVEAHPKLPASVKETARRAREAFVPRLDVLRQSYKDEAAAALENRPDLAAMKPALQEIAVPGGATLYTWVKGFVDAGDKIDGLLQKRAEAVATATNAGEAGVLRGSTIGLLSRFRDALRDELDEAPPGLPADHEVRLFAYVDQLGAERAAAAAKDAAKAGASGEAPPADEPPGK